MFYLPRNFRKFSYLIEFFKPKKRDMHSASKKPFTILVEGNIGCGKTTFLNNFKNDENILTVYEPIEKWRNIGGQNLMNYFYSDKNKWAFTFQTYVMLTMMKAHKTHTDRPVKMMERSIYSGRYVFIENLSNMKVLSKPDLSVLDEWFYWLIKSGSISVDLIVYLRTKPEVALRRIQKRAREKETFTLDYIEKIHQCHEDWLTGKNGFILPAPVLCLNANNDVETIINEYSCYEKQMKI